MNRWTLIALWLLIGAVVVAAILFMGPVVDYRSSPVGTGLH